LGGAAGWIMSDAWPAAPARGWTVTKSLYIQNLYIQNFVTITMVRAVSAASPDLHCTCYRLRKAARRVTALYDAALEPLGLTLTQFSVLAMIGAGGPRSVSALAEALGMDDSTLSRTLRPLIDCGHLVVATVADRRVKRLKLTPAGERLAGEAIPRWRAAQRGIERALGADVMRLHDTLGRLAGLAPDSFYGAAIGKTRSGWRKG
jgi:DNA-binding MarR family transcriptional regulator